MANPAANSPRECNCIDNYEIEADESLLRCAHYGEWDLVLIETDHHDGTVPIWSVQSNVPTWGELYTLHKQEAEEGFAFAEARFHEDDA